MRDDKRYLYRDGRYDDYAGLVFIVGPGAVTLTASGLVHPRSITIETLAGDNFQKADEQDWVALSDANGRPVMLSGRTSYILLTQPGVMRLAPSDLAKLPDSANVTVWMAGTSDVGQDSSRFPYVGAGGAGTAGDGIAGAEVTSSTLVQINDFTYVKGQLSEDVTIVSVKFAYDSQADTILYGFAANAMVTMETGDELILTKAEYNTIMFAAPGNTAKLVVMEYTE